MTQEEFYKLLSIRAKKHGFGCSYYIRENNTSLCPICAVADEKGFKYTNSLAHSAGAKLGLDEDFIEKIIDGADRCNKSEFIKLKKLVQEQ